MEFRALSLLLLAAGSLAAQQYRTPAFEVSGGFAAARAENEVDHYGVSGSWMSNFSRRVGLAVETAVLFGELEISRSTVIPPDADGRLSRRMLHVLVGPRIRLVTTDRYTVSVHAMTAWIRRTNEGLAPDSEGVPRLPVDIASNRIGGAVGGAFDVRLTNRTAWRIQPDWVSGGRNTGGNWFRLSTGLVIRFGSR